MASRTAARVYSTVFALLMCLNSGCIRHPTILPANPPKDSWTEPMSIPKTEELIILSKPLGAEVHFSTDKYCSTPCSIQASRDKDISFSISKSGYLSANKTVRSISLADVNKGVLNNLRDEKYAAFVANRRYLSPNPITVLLEPSWTKEQ